MCAYELGITGDKLVHCVPTIDHSWGQGYVRSGPIMRKVEPSQAVALSHAPALYTAETNQWIRLPSTQLRSISGFVPGSESRMQEALTP